MERIETLIKLPVSVNDSYKLIDADGLYILEVGIPYILTDKDIAITEALRDLINGQNVDVERMAEEYAARLRPYATNDFHEFTYSYNQIIEAVLYGSTLKQDWVSVEERLPDTDANVLVSWNGKTVTGFYIKEDPEWYAVTMAGRLRLKNITHWQPLPSPPKEKI